MAYAAPCCYQYVGISGRRCEYSKPDSEYLSSDIDAKRNEAVPRADFAYGFVSSSTSYRNARNNASSDLCAVTNTSRSCVHSILFTYLTYMSFHDMARVSCSFVSLQFVSVGTVICNASGFKKCSTFSYSSCIGQRRPRVASVGRLVVRARFVMSHMPSSQKVSDDVKSSARVQTSVQSMKRRLPPELLLITAAGVIGFGAGLSVTAFKLSIEHLQRFLYGDDVAGPLFGMFGGNNIAIIPALGGIAVGCLRAIVGHPFTGGLSDCVADPTSRIGLMKPFQKSFAAVLTLSSGASLGPEQGSVDIGAVCGQWLGQVLELNPARRQLLLAAGAASGLAAGFNAPFAGVFFALERLRIGQRVGSGGVDAAVVLLSASLSALVAQAGLGATPAFEPPVYDLKDPLLELPMWLAMGALCGVASFSFRSLLRTMDAFFNTSRYMRTVPPPLLPVLGATLCGFTALFFPQVLFFGYTTLSSLLADNGDFSLQVLFVLLFLKPLTTAVCLACGLVGGTVAPSLFLGAVVGASFQKVSLAALTFLHHSGFAGFTAGITITGAPAYSMIGMAAVLSGILRAPLTSSLLLFELTRDYRITVASIVAAGISSAIANFDGEDVSVKDSGDEYITSSDTISDAGKDCLDGNSASRELSETVRLTAPQAQEQESEYDDTDKAIELGRPLRTNLEIVLEQVSVENPQLLSSAPVLSETALLLDVVRSLLQSDSTAAIIVKTQSDAFQGVKAAEELVGIITLIEAEEALHSSDRDIAKIRCGDICEADCVSVKEGSSALVALDAMQRAGARHAVVVTSLSGSNDFHRVGIQGLVTVSGIEKFAAVKALRKTLTHL